MNDQQAPNRVSAPGQSEIYGEDYFHGRTSGYPKEGYAARHPDWSAWLDVLWRLRPGGVLIDAGCAYGYLVKSARERGYQAFGIDISGYALAQEPACRPWLAQADAARLPFKSGRADVVALFDVLEHLEDPALCLEEARRALKPDGLLIGATPDPIFFSGAEPTHVSERTPAWWLHTLERLGFAVQFRFSHDRYNFQFLATLRESPAVPRLQILQHDYFDETREDFIRISGPSGGDGANDPAASLPGASRPAASRLKATPRWGWGPLSAKGRAIVGSPASVYLLNPGPAPLALDVSARVSHSPDFSTLRLRLDSHALDEAALDSEQTSRTLEARDVYLPTGGHHLFFDLFPGGPAVTVESITLTARPASRAELTKSLPFDLYQRYRLASEIVETLACGTLLDIGGYIGDENGHLAVSHDFFQADAGPARIVVTDLRQCDHPDYLRAEALRQPFPDHSSDVVVSLDVLEHLHPDARIAFLAELDRVSSRFIVLGAPFWSAAAEAAERRLAGSLMATRRFLQEHQELGLPRRETVEDYFSRKGYTVRSFPNGYLPRWEYWQALTQHYFSFNDYQITSQMNAAYNSVCYPSDNRAPAYRTIYLVAKEQVSKDQMRRLEALTSSEPRDSSCLEALAEHPAFLAAYDRAARLQERRQKALTDAQFLVNSRQRLIEILRRDFEQTPLWRQALRRLRGRK